MSRRGPIRPDIHERFTAIVARAEAKLQSEEKAPLRRVAKPDPVAARPRGETMTRAEASDNV
jgi:hypothetical protein